MGGGLRMGGRLSNELPALSAGKDVEVVGFKGNWCLIVIARHMVICSYSEWAV